MKILSEELRKYTKPTHLVDFTLGQDSSGNPIFASASETAETIDGWLTAGENVVYRIQYAPHGYIYGTTTDYGTDSYIEFAAFISTSWFGPYGVYRLEANWGKTGGTWNALPTISSVIPMETDYNPGAIAPAFDEGLSYEVGDVVMYEGLRYRCTTAVSTDEGWNPSNWTLEDVQTAIDAISANVPIAGYNFNTVALTSQTISGVVTLCGELSNHAINIVQITSAETPVQLTFPSATSDGTARDFLLRLEITSSTVPMITFVPQTGDSLDFESLDGWTEFVPGVNLLTFAETKPGA